MDHADHEPSHCFFSFENENTLRKTKSEDHFSEGNRT